MPEPAPQSTSGMTARPSVRWKPVVIILLSSVVAWAILRLVPHKSEQHFYINVAKVILITLAALLAWILFLSRLRWKMRFLLIGGLFAALAVMAGLFRIRGVTGNLLPILEPRWASRDWQTPTASGTNTSFPLVTGASDFPQFLGPDRNGVLSGPRLAADWSVQAPELLWRQPIGAAWSGFVVAGSLAITQEQRGEEELTVCYELLSGATVWVHADKARYYTALAGEGPRATPAIAKSRVFAQGATGILNSLDLATGRLLWTRNIFEEHGSHTPDWGHSSSPLVLEDLVLVNAGGRKDRSLVAYRADDGTLAWSGGTAGTTYSSPQFAVLDGLPQILLFGGSLRSHDATSGRQLWEFPWPGGHPHIAMPVVLSDTDLILSSGYGTGSARISVQRDPSGNWNPKVVWRTNRLKAKFTNPVRHHGHLYGLDDGILACLDLQTGALLWKDGRYGHGQTLMAGQYLLVMAENGEVILIDPQPDRLRELCRFQALSGKTWNPPALAGRYLLVRNDLEAACYRLGVE